MDLRSVAALVALAACAGRGDEAAPSTAGLDARLLAGGVAPSGKVNAGENPFRGDRQSAAEGERTFVAMNCDGCHGAGATGWVGPSLRDGRWRYGGSDAQIFLSIYAGLPHGMPAYGGLLPPGAIWKVVAYIRSLEPPASVPTESWK